MITSYGTICAWCISEAGETPNPNDSHGCCGYHAGQLRQQQGQRLWNKLQNVPSYVETNAALFAEEDDGTWFNEGHCGFCGGPCSGHSS